MTLDYKGTSIFYKDQGKGPCIVFIHGFLEDSEMWNFFLPDLIERYRCICIDLFGHGQSGELNEVYTMELMADLIKHLLVHLKVKECILIGHSMGGYCALAFGELFPNMVKGMCLINSTALADDDQKRNNRDRAIELVARDKKTFISISISNLFKESNLLVYNKEVNDLKHSAYRISLKSIVNTLEGMKIRKDRTKLLSEFKTKRLVILGDSDPILSLKKQLEYLNRLYINNVVLEGGHMLQIENKYEISYKLIHFIE